jgi:hypothetical protein
MEKKELTEEAILNILNLNTLDRWSAKGPLCARLIQEGYNFSHEQIDNTLLKLEGEEKILSFPRGKANLTHYISTKKMYPSERGIYLREKGRYIQQQGVMA